MKRIALAALVISWAGAANAAFDQKDVCSAENELLPSKVVSDIMDHHHGALKQVMKIANKPYDADKDEDIKQLLLNIDLGALKPIAASKKDFGELEGVVSYISRIVKGDEAGFEANPKADVTKTDRENLSDFFNGVVHVTCVKPEEESWIPGRWLRIRKVYTDVGKAREKAADFNKLDSADLSFARDIQNNSTVLDADVAAGFDFLPADPWLSAVPFIQINRHLATNKGGGPTNNIEKLMAGLAFDNASAYGDLSIAPHLITDFTAGTKIADLALTLTPDLHDEIWLFQDYGVKNFWNAYFNSDVILKAGNVIDDGGNPQLRGTKNYVRGGFKPKFTVDGEGHFSDWSWSTSYQALWGRSAAKEWLPLVETSISYTLSSGELKTTSIKATYADGRDEDTKTRLEKLTVGLGFKF